MLQTNMPQPYKATLCSNALLDWPRYTPFTTDPTMIGKYCIYNGYLFYVNIEDQAYYMTPQIEAAKAALDQSGYQETELFIFPKSNVGGQINPDLLDITSSEGHQLTAERNRLAKIRFLKEVSFNKGISLLEPMEYDQTVEIDRLGIDVRLESDRQHVFLNPQNEAHLESHVGTYNFSMNGTLMFINEEGRTFVTPSWDYYIVLLTGLGYQHNPNLILPEKIASDGYTPTSGSVELDPITQKWNQWKADCIQRSQSQNDIYLRACEIFNNLNQVANTHSR